MFLLVSKLYRINGKKIFYRVFKLKKSPEMSFQITTEGTRKKNAFILSPASLA